MGIIDRISKKKATSSSKPEAKDEVKVVKKTPKKVSAKKAEAEVTPAVQPAAQAKTGGNSWRVLATPRVSEKAARMASHGTYTFNVPLSSNKVEIRKAVEALYGVHVVRVAIVRGIGKMTTRGRIRGQRSDWKKALVTLKQGEKIDLHEGV